ncbi:MAG: aminopeptidase-like protein [Saprospiraceae bacterium]|jgi:aminopeptidase-like protein
MKELTNTSKDDPSNPFIENGIMSIEIKHKEINATGQDIFALCERLYPICRSITGDGVRQTLAILQEYIGLETHEVPSGTAVFDWTVPKEWNIKDAWIKDAKGNKIVDFKNHNLHILNYSIPVHKKISLTALKEHLYTLPDQPDLIPYRTSYYAENWGFCITHHQFQSLEEGDYEVYIDTTLDQGHLTYGELYLPGATADEILFSAHICHPSLANDNLSGISILTCLAQWLSKQKNRYSYRFLFIPGTIGSITWLARNEQKTKNIKHGLVASLLGDPGGFTYKKSRQGDAEIDRVASHLIQYAGYSGKIIDFIPYGYDERQFCSPGFNLAVGNLTRSQFGEYPEYHTSADDLNLIQPACLSESFQLYQDVIEILEHNLFYKNLYPKCEPQLGKRGLYNAIGGNAQSKEMQMAMLWILNLADGNHNLLDIAERSGCSFQLISKVAQILLEHKLLKIV